MEKYGAEATICELLLPILPVKVTENGTYFTGKIGPKTVHIHQAVIARPVDVQPLIGQDDFPALFPLLAD